MGRAGKSVYNHDVIQYHPFVFNVFQTAFGTAKAVGNFGAVMKSILLAGLFQRLIIVLIALAVVWCIYFWAAGV